MPAPPTLAWHRRTASTFAALVGRSLLIGVVAASAAHPQNLTVLRGTLVDSASRPVPDATVRLASPRMSVVTDSTGRFGFSLGRRERLAVLIARVGFAPETALVNFAGRVLVDTTIVVGRTAIALPTVRVESDIPDRYRGIGRYEDFYERRRMAIGGSFFDRDALERHGSVARAMNSVAGVRAEEGMGGRLIATFSRCRPSLGRSPPVAIIIDGVYLASMSPGDISTNDVETLEVYVGVSQVPPVARGDACAAIVVTTRLNARRPSAPAPGKP